MATETYKYQPRGRPVEERFWEKVDQSSGPDACWTWQASMSRKGYGQFRYTPSQAMAAHRVAYILTYGEIPSGMALDHVCQNPACVNPKHLSPITTHQNSKLRWARSPAPKPAVTRSRKNSVEERFWEKVDTSGGILTCWPWIGYITPNGYGTFSLTRMRPEPAHRVAFKLNGGSIPDGMQIDHVCRNRACVNPSHLEMVTPSENQRRRLDHHPSVFKCGHEATADNTRFYGTTWFCRQCRNQYMRERYARKKGYTPVSMGQRTHFACGCPKSEENTFWVYKGTPKRYRRCKKCQDEKRRAQSIAEGRKPPPGKRTHCPKGHPYDDRNTYRDNTGRRHCRTCRSGLADGKFAIPMAQRTHCPEGHPYDENNTIWNRRAKGLLGRACRACTNGRRRARRAAEGRKPSPKERTHCPQGHPYDDANTYRDKSGRRNCRECRKVSSNSRRASRNQT